MEFTILEQSNDPHRRSDLAKIHMTAKALFGDVSKGGLGRSDYEDWLEKYTGKRSAAHLSKTARFAFLKRLRREGIVPAKKAQGGKGADRPTSSQWAYIAKLARELGWQDGLEDARLQGFVERTAKISSARFLKRSDATKVINGLEVWLAQRQRSLESAQNAMS
jgi:hypothetical protein